MSGIRGKDTKPEMFVRKGLHRLGFRFRLHDRSLPGTPDLVLPKYNAVVFVHGCFWHGHDCHLGTKPATRKEFWAAKFEENRARDRKAREALLKKGWRVLEIWECAMRGVSDEEKMDVLERAAAFLLSNDHFGLIRS